MNIESAGLRRLPGNPGNIEPPSRDSHRRLSTLPSLTGLRWYAALLVFLYHVSVVQYFGGRPALLVKAAFGPGETGVSFFFILSGFVLSWSAPKVVRAAPFWRKRFARIYPVHFATALLALALAFTLAPGTKPGPTELVANLALVHAWIPKVGFYQSMNPVSWSLACEAFFYFLFPLLILLLRRLSSQGNTIILVACLALEFLIPMLAHHFLPARELNFLLYYFPPARLPEFVLGMALAQLVIAGRWRGPGLKTSLAMAVAGYFLTFFLPVQYSYFTCTAIGITCLLAATARADVESEPTPWRSRRAVKLGERSFAFYMTHLLVMRTGEYVFRAHPREGWFYGSVAVLASFAISFAIAGLLHNRVEKPMRKLLLSSRHTTRPGPPSSTITPAPTPAALVNAET